MSMVRLGMTHWLVMVSGALLACSALLVACKQSIDPPKALPSPSSPPQASSPIGGLAAQADARCSQLDLWVCNVSSDLVTLCNEKETDKAPCNDRAWSKSLYDRILKLQQGGNVELAACSAPTLYVNTQADELLLREQASKESSIIGEGARGSSVTCVGVVKGSEWTKVKIPSGQEGFMFSAFLSQSRPAGGSAASGGGGGGSSRTCRSTNSSGYCVCIKEEPEGGERPVDFEGQPVKCEQLNGKPYDDSWWWLSGGARADRLTVNCRTNPDPGMFKEKDCLCFVVAVTRKMVKGTQCEAGWRAETPR